MNDEIEIIPSDWKRQEGSIIKVIGVGGGGGNAVNHMFHKGIKAVDFVVCNTDHQALASSPVEYKIQLGEVLTRGRGAGCNPEQGRQAALESESKIRELLGQNTEMVFITAGMGGGTGTGAAPVIAQIAREMGILTVGIVTLPFRHEGIEFIKRAHIGIHEMKQQVDSLLIIDNQKLYDMYGELSIFDAFPKADEVLSIAAKGIAEIITQPGFINVDFADVKMVMKDSGVAIMGSGTASGEQRALMAVEQALSSPLLNDSDVSGAKNVLVNITSSGTNGLTMSELEQIMHYVQERTGDIENCKRGVVRDDSIGDAISVTVVATGFGIQAIPTLPEPGPPRIRVRAECEDLETETEPETDRPAESSADGTIHVKTDRRVFIIDGAEKKAATPAAPKTPANAPEKPALILGKDSDIKQLETVPAYLRRKNADAPLHHTGKVDTEAASRIVTVNGVHRLNHNNSFLYRTQD
jgi:cell division protein FtsZ